MKHHAIKDQYDVVVIGAGVGGLTAAAFLSKAGLSVCVLEKEGHPGGYLAGFRRKDFRFDTAIHWLNQCSPEGLLHHVFDALGKDHPTPGTQRRIRRYLGKRFDYLLTNNPEEFREQLLRDYPHERAGIDKFFKAARSLCRPFKEFSKIFRSDETMGTLEVWRNKMNRLRFALPFIPFIFYSGEKGFEKGLSKFFKDPELKKLFSCDPDILSTLIPISWAYNNDFQVPPTGGGQVIPEWLEHVILAHGGELHYKCAVREVFVEKGRVTGVRLDHHGQPRNIQCAHVVAACDVEYLYERLLPAGTVPEKLKQKLRDAELYASSLTISIALDRPSEELGFGEEGIHIADEDLPYALLQNGDPYTSELHILAPSVRDKTLSPQGCGTLTLFMPAFMDYEDNWRTGDDGKGGYVRGEAYKALKQRVAEIVIDRVAKSLCPSLKEHILFFDVATPVTHQRYTWNRGGTMMGARPGKKNFQLGIAHYRTPVRNLVLGGHWAELGGGVPIAVKAGANAALIVLRDLRPEAYGVLARYVDHRIDLEAFRRSAAFKPSPEDWVRKPTPAEERELRGPVHQDTV